MDFNYNRLKKKKKEETYSRFLKDLYDRHSLNRVWGGQDSASPWWHKPGVPIHMGHGRCKSTETSSTNSCQHTRKC